MLRTFITFIILNVVVARLQQKAKQVNDKYTKKIVIIGAGLGGVTAAKRLEESGYTDITILEKNDYVGGKCSSSHYEDYEGSYENGAGVFSQSKNTHIRELVDEYKLETKVIPPFSHTLADPLNFEAEFFQPGGYEIDSLSDTEKIKLQGEIDLFNELFSIDDMSKPGLKNMDQRLCVSFNEWAKENNIEFLQQTIMKQITYWGYGYLVDDMSGEIALPYVMKYQTADELFPPSNMRLGSDLIKYDRSVQEIGDDEFDPPGYNRSIKSGFQSLVESIADSLQYTNIITSAEIVKFDRFSDNVVLRWVKDGRSSSDTFQKSIVAFPQTIKNLESSHMDLSAKERKMFSKVRTRSYNGVYIPLSCVDAGKYIMAFEPGSAADIPKITLQPDDAYWMTSRARESNGKSLVHIVAYSENDLTQEDVEKTMISYVKTLCNETVSVEDFREFKQHDYFPHVDAKDFGFYDEVYAIQGEKNTFWLGGLFNIEMTEKTVEFSYHIVDEFF